MPPAMRRRLLSNRFLLLAVGLAGLVLLAVLAVRQLTRPSDAAWGRIQADQVFLVATDASYVPFSVVDADGNLFGFDIDLAEAIAARWGVQARFENITYDALLGTLISGRDDAVVSAFVLQPERTRQVSYTQPYFISGIVIVVPQAEAQALGADPLLWAAGKVLAVEYGAGGDALARGWARGAAGIQMLPRPTAAEAMAAVEAGQADAALVDALSAYDYLSGHPGLKLAGPTQAPEPYVVAVSVKSPTLLHELDQALAAMQADGSLEELRVKWFGEAARARGP
jgi:ABC-type amino acid transport substrate-binding protein